MLTGGTFDLFGKIKGAARQRYGDCNVIAWCEWAFRPDAATGCSHRHRGQFTVNKYDHLIGAKNRNRNGNPKTLKFTENAHEFTWTMLKKNSSNVFWENSLVLFVGVYHPILDFLWCLSRFSKSGWIALLVCSPIDSYRPRVSLHNEGFSLECSLFMTLAPHRLQRYSKLFSILMDSSHIHIAPSKVVDRFPRLLFRA